MYKVINDDCLNAIDLLEDNSIDCVITDPPYGIDQMNSEWDYEKISKSISKSAKSSVGSIPVGMKFNPKDAIKLQNFLEKVSSKLILKLKPGAFCVVFSQPRSAHRVALAFENSGFEVRDQLMWHYGAGQGKAQGVQNFVKKTKKISEDDKPLILEKLQGLKTPQLTPCYETMWLFQKPKVGTFVENYLRYGVGLVDFNHKKWRVVFEHKKPSKIERQEAGKHPTLKPISLLEDLVKAFCPANGTVLDCFLGSGTTVIASIKNSRNSVGIEKDLNFYNIAKERIKKHKEDK